MKAVRWIVGGLLAAPFVVVAIFFAVAFIDKLVNSYSYRERITLSVQTPTGVVTGTGVWATHIRGSSVRLTPETSGASMEHEGEAIPLELAPGKWLFVLFSGTEAEAIVRRQNVPGIGPHTRALKATIGDSPVELGSTGLSLGTFLDIDTPNSFRFVKGDDLAAVFGPGFELLSATVEITRDRVTEGQTIQVLDWWMDYRFGPPYYGMMFIKMPDDSPRGWRTIGSDLFWSGDQEKKIKKMWEKMNGIR